MGQQTVKSGDLSAVQKLGVGPNQRVEVVGDLGGDLRKHLKNALGRGFVRSGELDGAIVLVESLEQAALAFERYLPRLRATGYLWLVTHKLGHDSYINHVKLLPFARQCGLIDNKTCSLDDTRSAIRFVTPRSRRASASA